MTSVDDFADPNVQKAFLAFPDEVRPNLLHLRTLIFETAAGLSEIGALHETLKWGQPAYLTPDTGAATTIRLGIPKSGGYALYTHCQSSVMSEIQALFPNELTFEGNRAILFAVGETPPAVPLTALIARALTYHLKRP
ncbi:DUF1801 domain-containing protein [Aliiroseovarius sp. S253]|uniref:DUF1801 domain-containing protein n=1 Tax=Aliiroseovarius sp. S253 TaxID=3415133 RepID=UPI003C7D03D9